MSPSDLATKSYLVMELSPVELSVYLDFEVETCNIFLLFYELITLSMMKPAAFIFLLCLNLILNTWEQVMCSDSSSSSSSHPQETLRKLCPNNEHNNNIVLHSTYCTDTLTELRKTKTNTK